jgi:hypothetical protein
MTTGLKFVVVESTEFGKHTFAFPSSIEHDHLAKVADYLRHGDGRNWKRVKCTLVASGVIGQGAESLKNQFLATEMKYIVTDSDEGGKQLFIFPKNLNHDRVADVLSEVKEAINGELADNFYREPVSAGFTDGKTCYGKSESLDLKSDKGDTALLKALLNADAPVTP